MQPARLSCKTGSHKKQALTLPAPLIFSFHTKIIVFFRILRMWESGQLSRFREQWLYLVNKDPCALDTALPSFTLKNVALPFYIFGAGALASIIVLVIEQLVYYANRK
jgi:hypothetical protein